MLKRIVIVLLGVSTLFAVIVLPANAQVADGFLLDRQGQRLAASARTEEDRKKAEGKFQATEYYEKSSEIKRRNNWPWGAVNKYLQRVVAFLKKAGGKETLDESFFEALRIGHTEMVRKLLAKGVNGNELDQYGQVPLETAAENGSMEMVKLLLDNGADLKKRNRYGRTALDASYTTAMLHGHEEIARLFLDMGVNVNAIGPAGRTAFQCAMSCSPQFVKMLVERGADVNAKTDDGKTALMYAARSGKVETTRFLLDKGADVNAKANDGDTALMALGETLGSLRQDAFEDYLEVVKLLLDKGVDINAKDTHRLRGGFTPIIHFSAVGWPEGVKLLLENGADVNATLKDGSNALFWALSGDTGVGVHCLQILGKLKLPGRWQSHEEKVPDKRRFETAKLLITHGINVNAKLERDGSTALIWAAFLGDVELVRLLLEKGAEVNVRLTDGLTPLLCAMTGSWRNGIHKSLGSRFEVNVLERNRPPAEKFSDRRMEMVKLLLDHGADVNALPAKGTTALMWAINRGQAEMVQLLLERGADPNAKLRDGSTLLQSAALLGCAEVVKLLIEHGARATLAAAALSGLNNEVRRLLDQGSDVNARDTKGRTAFMECARRGNLDTARLLIDRGADPSARDERGWTAFMEAMWNNRLDMATLLLERGVDPNVADDSGWTPLMQAAWKGLPEAVNLLLTKGVDVNAKDPYGKTPLMRAVEMGNREVGLLLLDKGADVKTATADGCTLVMIAAERRDVDMTRLLRERGAAMTLVAAALLGDKKEIQRIIADAEKNGTRIDGPGALLTAVREGRGEVVTLLLDKCPGIDLKQSYGGTALLDAVKDGNTGIAKALLDKGANVNAADSVDATALHHAVSVENPALVRMLLAKGAYVDAMAGGGDTPLIQAIRKGNGEIVKALLEKDPSLKPSGWSNSALEMARIYGRAEIVELLMAHVLAQND
ncbi:MAG: ankyrin repeat domain-containing protein [Pseudomonadota bacterium]